LKPKLDFQPGGSGNLARCRRQRSVIDMNQSQEHPRHAQLQRARLTLSQGKLREAKALYEELCRQDPKDAESHYVLGSIYGQLGAFTQAVESLRRAVNLQPSAAAAHYGLGSALEARKNWPEAERSYRETLRLRPDFPDAAAKLARVLVSQGKLSEAEQSLRAYLEVRPRSATALVSLGEVHHARRELSQAIECYSQALDIEPGVADVHYRLGVAWKALGKLPEAERSFREAYRLQPDFADAAVKLASILLNQRRHAEAEHCLRGYLGRHPRSAEALVGLGELHDSRRELQEAIAFYRRALDIDPNLAHAHYRLGNALQILGAVEEAIAPYQTAVKLNPVFTDAYTGLGNAFANCGRAPEARAAYSRALEINPDCIMAIIGDAALYEREGDYQAAYDRILPLVQRGVEHPMLGTTFASICRHFGRSDEGIAYLERLLQGEVLWGRQEEQVRRTLGKFYDKRGRYQEAFAHYRRANALRSSHYDPDAHVATIDGIIATFSSTAMAAAPRSTNGSQRPVFIVGMPRSGTSLTEQILSSHPDVFGAGELFEITKIAQRLAGASTATGPDYRSGIQGLTQDVVDTLAARYLSYIEDLDSQAARVTDKLPGNHQHLGVIALLFPKARVVHCMRDPRDDCLSIYFQHLAEGVGWAHDLRSLGHYYRQYERLMAHWRSVLDIPMLEIRYEELVTNQEAVSRQLIEFIGLDWDARCLAFHETQRVVATPSYDQVREPMYTSSMARWKNYESAIGPLITALAMDG
jgi:tetratricopeptide (TPR) repeat protein